MDDWPPTHAFWNGGNWVHLSGRSSGGYAQVMAPPVNGLLPTYSFRNDVYWIQSAGYAMATPVTLSPVYDWEGTGMGRDWTPRNNHVHCDPWGRPCHYPQPNPNCNITEMSARYLSKLNDIERNNIERQKDVRIKEERWKFMVKGRNKRYRERRKKLEARKKIGDYSDADKPPPTLKATMKPTKRTPSSVWMQNRVLIKMMRR
jgi:hypothetical protein